MIDRYTYPQMARVWSVQNRYSIWLDIETYALEALAELGQVPHSAVEAMHQKRGFNVQRIEQIDQKIHHDFLAFLTNLNEHVGEQSRFIHQGLTSSDVLDTAFAAQLNQAVAILRTDLENVLKTLKQKAYEYKDCFCIGRSHGVHAEPTTFGLKLASFYAEFERQNQRLKNAQAEIATCAISGAVGTFANVDPRVEEYVAKKMNLKVEPISTQVIPRDRHAMFFATLGVVASSVEHLAVEIRHLQRTEVQEVQEYFAESQKGSSAMPHKKNPILSENLTGLARLVRASVQPALENVSLWHERDISHSSVERVIAPDATATLDFALRRLNKLLEGLVVRPKKMLENLNMLGGLVHSQQVLLALVKSGLSREAAYEIVQTHALKVWEKGGDFLASLQQDPRVSQRLAPETLLATADLKRHAQHVDSIFNRVFKPNLKDAI